MSEQIKRTIEHEQRCKKIYETSSVNPDREEYANYHGLAIQALQSELDRQDNKPIEHVADIKEQEWYWIKHLETNKIVCIHVDRFLDARATGYDTHIIISEKQRYSLDMWEIYKHKPTEGVVK